VDVALRRFSITLAIGLITGTPIILGLEPREIVPLLLSMGVSILTFALERTNAIQGAIHLLLFLAYLMLIFD
jgi:Ca2+:H+ antiporter